MNYKIFLIIISFFLIKTSFGQVFILDSISNNPVPAVSVFNFSGTLLCVSDKNGKVHLEKEKVTSQDKLTFQHLSYNPKQIRVGNLYRSGGIIKLLPSTNMIDEVEISNKSKDWLILRGYFRALETFDGRNKYFSDGIVQFYIPLTETKEKKYFRRLSSFWKSC